MTKEDVLKQCKVNGLNVYLPDMQLDRKLYLEIAKALELIGGQWKGGKIKAFVFQEDPTELLSEIATGEKRNLKKEFQFFETPVEIADWLVELANIKDDDLILEPSAGQGAIIEAILRINQNAAIVAVELMEINSKILEKKGFVNECADFLTMEMQPAYDKIIANPPFSKNQDIDHITRMYEVLAPGGRIVTVASKHWQFSQNKKETNFRSWIEEIDADVYEIEPGAFKDSGTMVGSVVLVINK